MTKQHYQVDFEPIGRRGECSGSGTILDAAQHLGVALISLCGGSGTCGRCKVQVLSGEASPPTSAEKDGLRTDELHRGYRLACQAYPLSPMKIHVPPESLSTPQRTQVESLDVTVQPQASVAAHALRAVRPTLGDLRADSDRVLDVLQQQGVECDRFDLEVLRQASSRLRAWDWQARAVVRDTECVALLPTTGPLLGLAVDLGTTKVAGYLLDLESGKTVASHGIMNPQIAYGEDILSRIGYAEEHEDGRGVLQTRLMATLNDMIGEMCAEKGITRDQVVEAVAVGNTAMHHLFAGLPVRQLAMTPYVPSTSKALECTARDIGLGIAGGACVYLLPNIAGYVGADHVAVIVATDIWKTDRISVAVDIGTNTEITLAARGRLLSCSCASGPAFEGAHIRDGMRAADGAIERVQINDEEIRTFTIGGKPPVGICGSGILDAVAEMRARGILDDKGALRENHARVRQTDHLSEFVLVPAEATGHGRDITLNRKDVNEIQLAKGAIRTGLELLLIEAGIAAKDVEDFIVAGAFGTYISIPSAIRVGMFPNLPLDRFRQVGNAAGMGAKQALISLDRRRVAQDIVKAI